MKIISMTLGDLATNCYVLIDEATNDALLIDPAGEPEVIKKVLSERNLHLKKIVLTHGHGDHIGALPELRKAYPDVPVLMHEADEAYLADPRLNLSAYHSTPVTTEPADEYLKAGDRVELGSISLEVLETPGHTPGGISLYDQEVGVVFSGDALFNGSIGRTDFPGGSMEELLQSIRTELLTLPEETVVLSGHGPATQIGEEKMYNPFLGGQFGGNLW